MSVPLQPRGVRLIVPAQRPAQISLSIPVPGASATADTDQFWLALHLPEWPLYAARQVLPAEERRALGERPVVVQQLLEALAGHCQMFTPVVVIDPPDGLALEVRGSAHLFGGVHGLLQAVGREIRERGITARMAMSATLRSAQWLARGEGTLQIVSPAELASALASLSLQVLRWPVEIERRLQDFGVVSVGDLLRLPRAGLARRIGPERLRELDQAQGRDADVRRAHQQPERYRDHVLLDFEIETTTLLETLIARRLPRLAQFLLCRNAAIRELVIHLHHRDEPLTALRIGLAAPSADMRHIVRLLHEALGALRLRAPVREIDIVVDEWWPLTAGSSALAFDPQASRIGTDSSSARARLLEQLQARLGLHRIRTLAHAADHRPGRTQVETAATLMSVSTPATDLAPLSLRPLWLLPEARRLGAEEMDVHDRAFTRRPERIQGGWWDGAPVERDYQVARSRAGALWWVYRDRARPDALYLHGLFA